MYQQCSIRLFPQVESSDNSSDKISNKNINIIAQLQCHTINICKTTYDYMIIKILNRFSFDIIQLLREKLFHAVNNFVIT